MQGSFIYAGYLSFAFMLFLMVFWGPLFLRPLSNPQPLTFSTFPFRRFRYEVAPDVQGRAGGVRALYFSPMNSFLVAYESPERNWTWGRLICGKEFQQGTTSKVVDVNPHLHVRQRGQKGKPKARNSILMVPCSDTYPNGGTHARMGKTSGFPMVSP